MTTKRAHLEQQYLLLSSILREGLNAELLDQVKACDALSSVTDAPVEYDEDEALAAHFSTLNMEVMPCESLFLGGECMLGGDITDSVVLAYAQGGFTPSVDDISPDHIGVELAYMAWLVGAESEATDDKQLKIAERCVELQREFLDKHLLRWLGAMVVSVEETKDDTDHGIYYIYALRATHRLAVEHMSLIAQGDSTPECSWSLPEAVDLLSEEKTGLREIAQFLVTPALAGAFISRAHIQAIGRAGNLPRGFGPRRQILTTLLRTGVDYSQIDEVVTGLTSLFGGWQEELKKQDCPHNAPWIERIDQTMGILGKMDAAIGDGA
jgi:TorA maturation chaperone TorD